MKTTIYIYQNKTNKHHANTRILYKMSEKGDTSDVQ